MPRLLKFHPDPTPLLFAMLAVIGLTGCRLVEGVFKAGLWFGVIMVILVVGLIGGGLSLFRRR